MGMGYMPVASGVSPIRRTGMEGVPFLGGGGGPFGALVGLALAPQYQQMMGQVGMTPMGLGHDQNIYDVMRAMQLTRMQMEAVKIASESDRAGYMKTMQGMAALTGTPFGSEQRLAASNLVSGLVAAGPMLTEIAPDLMDQLSGIKGSSAVLARRMIDAGRYRVDPISGRLGMSAETTGLAARRLYEDLYSDRNLSDMHGVSAGKLGFLVQELQSRGMLSTAAAEKGYERFDDRGQRLHSFAPGDTRGETYRAVDDLRRNQPAVLDTAMAKQGITSSIDKLTAQDLDKLMLDPGVADKLRAFDTERMKRSIKTYTHAVAAMRDIFGDMGHPDAPMQQLVAGLEAMTLGSSHQMDQGKMSMMVRQTYNLAKQSGVTLDNALILQQHAAQRAQYLGIEPIFAVQATQGALAFGGAYRGQGHAAHTAWGVYSADQMQQLDLNARVQASDSNMANQLATIMRIHDQVGGFEEGSKADQIAKAIMSGTPIAGLNMNEQEFSAMMLGAKTKSGMSLGLTSGQLREFSSQRPENREYGAKYEHIGDLTRRAQGDELWNVANNEMVTVLQDRLSSRLKGPDAIKQATEMASAISTKAVERIRNLSTEEFADPAKRNAAVGSIIEEELRAKGHGAMLDGMGKDERSMFLRLTAEQWYGRSNASIAGSGYAQWGNLQNIHRLNNKNILNAAEGDQLRAANDARMQEAMSPLGRGTILSRAVDALQDVDIGDKDAVLKVLAGSLGGVRNDEVNEAMLGPMTELMRKREILKGQQAALEKETDPKKRVELEERLKVTENELLGHAQDLAKISDQFGLGAGGISKTEIERGTKSGDNLKRMTEDVQKEVTGKSKEDRSKWFGSFFDGEDGNRFRRYIETANEDVNNLSTRLIDSPAGLKRLGSQAVKMSEELTQGQQRLRELARYHSGGDLARLEAGELNPNISEEGAAQVREEVKAIRAREQSIHAKLAETDGKPGRHFDPKQEATILMGLRPGQTMTPEQAKRHALMVNELEVAKKLTPVDEALIARHKARDNWTDEAKKTDKIYLADEAAFQTLMAEHGVKDRKLMYGSQRVLEDIALVGKEELDKRYAPAEDVTRSVLRAYGTETPEGGELTTEQKKLASLFRTTVGREMAHRMIGVRSVLKGHAEKGKFAGKDDESRMDQMLREYQEVISEKDQPTRLKKIKEFQQKAGIDGTTDLGRDQWDALQSAIQFEQNMGFSKYGKTRKYRNEEDLYNMIDQATRGDLSHVDRDGRAVAGHQGPLDIRLSGKVTLEGNQLDMSQAHGGDRAFVPGTA